MDSTEIDVEIDKNENETHSETDDKAQNNKQPKCKKLKLNESLSTTSTSSNQNQNKTVPNITNQTMLTLIRQVELKRKYLDHVIQVLNQTHVLLNSMAITNQSQ
jgi:hypothetical protein